MEKIYKTITFFYLTMMILTTAFASSAIHKDNNQPESETIKEEKDIKVVMESAVTLTEKVMRIVEIEDGVKIMFGISAGVYRLKSSNENFKVLLNKLKESKKSGSELKITANSTSLEILNAE